MSALPAVTVVFATLHHSATVRALLDALDATDWPDLEYVAVDCGSTDPTFEFLRARAARETGRRLTVMRAPGIGRATALNMAIAAAGDRDVVRMHADVVPDTASWLHQLHAVLVTNPDCGIVGAKITMAGGRIQTCGRELINGLGIIPDWSDRRYMEADRNDPSGPLEVDGVAGELCWIRRAVFDAVGDLDANFDPVNGDDDDLCLRARFAGFKVMVEPGVRGVHYTPRHTRLTHPELGSAAPLEEQRSARERLLGAHRDYWRRKWGFDPRAPDLHEVRRRYGHTRICWRIGERLTEQLPERPAVDVCLVTWNSLGVLPRFFHLLAATRWHDVRVWITDNGSTDGTVEWLRERAATFPFPMHVEALPQNVGVAQALNLAFAKGSAPIVARLDDDAFVPPEWIERMVPRFHQRPYAGVVSPQVAHDNPDATLQNGPLRMWPTPFHGTGPRDGHRLGGLCRVITSRGCCNLYRRSVFAIAGMLDVRFSPSQFDEWDHHITCAVAGYELLYDGSVVVKHQLHAGRMSTPAGLGNYLGNQFKTDAKWGGNHWRSLDRAIDLSIDGRFLPPDGDTSALHRGLPAVSREAPLPVPRDRDEVRELVDLGIARSRWRKPDSALSTWWLHQIEICENANRVGHGYNQALVMALMDLAPHFPRALMAVAHFRCIDGEVANSARTARWALRLDPGDPVLRRTAQAIVSGELVQPPPPADDRPVRVVLLPPAGHDEVAERMTTQITTALDTVDVSWRIDHRMQPTLDGVEVVHVVGLRDAATLCGRLQYVRATAPACRIVLSTLTADPQRGSACCRQIASHFFTEPDLGRRFYAELVAGQHPSQPVAVPEEHALTFERRCFDFADEVLCHSDEEFAFLQARHPGAATLRRCDEGLSHVGDADSPGCATDAAVVPFGGVLVLGPRDLQGNHHAIAMAFGQGDVPVTMAGQMDHPFGDWFLRAVSSPALQMCGPIAGREREAALRRSAVFLWLPSDVYTFELPIAAAVAGCELVIARGIGAEALFGEHATYVDPHDLPALQAAVRTARARWRDDAAEPWRRALAERFAPEAFAATLLDSYCCTAGANEATPNASRADAVVPI